MRREPWPTVIRFYRWLNWRSYLTLNGVIMARGLNPNDYVLRRRHAPHETAAVLRMHRAGMSATKIMEILGYNRNTTRLMREMQRAMDQETTAHRLGFAIHDAVIKRVP